MSIRSINDDSMIRVFQSTSSEEDVVSIERMIRDVFDNVSIHVLRRGRCVICILIHLTMSMSFNPRPPKRTLCP